MRVKYDEIPLSKIIEYFVDSYSFPDEDIYDYDFWIDNDELVIKLYLQEKDQT